MVQIRNTIKQPEDAKKMLEILDGLLLIRMTMNLDVSNVLAVMKRAALLP